MTVFIVYPGLDTVGLSFMNKDPTQSAATACLSGEPWWGIFENCRYVLTSEIMRTAFLNNLTWIILMVNAAVGVGLLIAVLADHVRYEPVAKAIIFTPMTISFVGAGVIRAFYRLALPLAIPAISSLAIFQFLWVWNELLVAPVFLGGQTPVMTCQIGNMVTSYRAGWHLLTAAAFVSMVLPMVVFFAFH